MKAQDDQRWATQERELLADEPGKAFHKYYTFWFDAAEKMVDEAPHLTTPEGTTYVTAPQVAEKVRAAFLLAEQELGILPEDWIGMMLCVATMHWFHGPMMAQGLTAIEQRLSEWALAKKIAQLQKQAAAEVQHNNKEL